MLKQLTTAVVAATLASAAHAAYIIEIDTDAADDGVLTYNPYFSFGGDTTTASQSLASGAFGMSGGDSLFGGNGTTFLDTYVYFYAPPVQGDNLVVPAGTDLGSGVLASGLTAGGQGTYRVWATWPTSDNISGGDTTFIVNTVGDALITTINQNGIGDQWVLLGEIDYTAGGIVVTQQAGLNTFVSMRSAGVLFEPIPEPSTLSLLAVSGLFLRRRH